MAISYGLELEAEIEPRRLLHIISNRLGLEWQKDILKGHGITVYAYLPDDFDRSVTEQEFGFCPAVCVGFRINPNKAYEEGIRIVSDATMTLFREVSKDAVLLFNADSAN